MVAGIGIGTALGINGGIGHLFNNILYKALLFMCMGAVIYATGIRYLTELGGLAKKMPVTTLTCIIAALSISGVPGFNGFVSKGMVIEAAAERGMHLLEIALILGSVGTLLSFLKLTYFVFFSENKKMVAVKKVPLPMQFSMLTAAFLCILFGVYPQLLFNWLPHEFEYHPFSLLHFSNTTQLLAMTAAIFSLRLNWFVPHAKVTYDIDYLYRKSANGFLWLAEHPISRFDSRISEIYDKAILKPAYRAARFLWSIIDVRLIDGAVNGIARLIENGAGTLRHIQSCQLQHYALVMVLGFFVILSMYLLF